MIYPERLIEDERYAYAMGVIRSLEQRLLDRSRWERLIEAETPDDALRTLADSDYSAYLPELSSPHEYERMLVRERERVHGLLERLMADPEYLVYLRTPFDYHNLRIMLKAKIKEMNLSHLLTPFGNIPPAEMERIFQDERYDKLPSHLQVAVERGVVAYYEKYRMDMLDHAVDRCMFEYLTSLEFPFMRNYWRCVADLVNIRTVLRLDVRDEREKMRWVYIPGGFLPEKEFMAACDAGMDYFLHFISRFPYREVVEDGYSYLKRENSFLRFERLMEEFLLRYLSITRYHYMGPEVLVSYWGKKEQEIKNLRIVLSGKINRVPQEVIRERIAV